MPSISLMSSDLEVLHNQVSSIVRSMTSCLGSEGIFTHIYNASCDSQRHL